MRIGVIGDIHGHKSEMVRILGRVAAHKPDRIILLGDLVDRGPDSFGCLQVARRWRFEARNGRKRSLEVVSGNHEDCYWRWAFGIPKPGRSEPARAEYPVFAGQLAPRDIAWFRRLPLYLRIETRETPVLIVHGGVLPSMREIGDLDERVLRVRYLDAKGDVLPWPEKSRRFWADDYDGRFGFAVFGHESWSTPTYFPWALGLDGHSYGKIHAVLLSDERSGLRVSRTFSVPYEWTKWSRWTAPPARWKG